MFAICPRCTLNLKIFSVIVVLLVTFSINSVNGDGYSIIVPSEVHTLIGNESVFLLDVRSENEFKNDGHIPNAYLIPVDELSTRKNELPTNFSQIIIVYCLSGSRSMKAATQLDQWNYTDVRMLEGGILAWKAIYPTEVVYNNNTTTNITIFPIEMFFIVLFTLGIIKRFFSPRCT